MRHPEEVAEVAAEFMSVAVAAERRTPWVAAARISAAVAAECMLAAVGAECMLAVVAAECMSAVAAAECVSAERPMSAPHRVWAACAPVARLVSPAGRRYRTLPGDRAASGHLPSAAVQAGPRR